jgi:glycerophosphoryl diester phosphodiesterase
MVVIGHRGAMGYEPENTLRSLQKALELGVDMVEFDVHILRDGEVILMHDDTLDRTTNGHGFVADKTLSEMKKLHAGKGEKVPTLQEALDLIDRKVPVVIEIAGFVSGAEKVATIIKHYIEEKGWKYENFLVSSFIHDDVRMLKKLLPRVKVGINISGIPVSRAKVGEETGADFIATENLYLRDADFVKDAHERGLKFFVYSLDSAQYLKRYESFGIDGFFSNKPDMLRPQPGSRLKLKNKIHIPHPHKLFSQIKERYNFASKL